MMICGRHIIASESVLSWPRLYLQDEGSGESATNLVAKSNALIAHTDIYIIIDVACYQFEIS